MAPNDTKIETKDEDNDKNIVKIYRRSHPLTPNDGDDIVITGVSGRYPNCRNQGEFEHCLYNKIDMVSNHQVWVNYNFEIPRRCGFIPTNHEFDAKFFGFNDEQAEFMDQQFRQGFEVMYEAILDAGINPADLKGSRYGIYAGACISEMQLATLYTDKIPKGFGILGNFRYILINQFAKFLGILGPVVVVDTACSSSMTALDIAYTHIKNGLADGAILVGSSSVSHPIVTIQFFQLGVLAPDGKCRPFDNNASGYTRSEAIPGMVLQRRRDACRVYASLVHSKANCDGYKEAGITFPSGQVQELLLRDFYDEAKIDINEIGYVEAHSTGTVVGDPEECRAICNVLCANRKEPLLCGSIKSNLGHTEPASALCSVAKVLLAFDKGLIAPNLHFASPRQESQPLVEGLLKPVTEITELKGDFVAINSFGFGGANAHILIRRNMQIKKRLEHLKDGLPRLVLWAGRCEKSVNKMLDNLSARPLDAEYVALLHHIKTENINGFSYRSFGIFTQPSSDLEGNAVCLQRNVKRTKMFEKLPILAVFEGFGTDWRKVCSNGTILDYLMIPTFRETISKLDHILRQRGVNLVKLLTSNNSDVLEANPLNVLVCTVAIEIALFDTLRFIGVEPQAYIGYSFGELICAYADNCLTAEQTILAAYMIGRATVEAKNVQGALLNVSVDHKKVTKFLPTTLQIAGNNGPNSCIISGPREDVLKFADKLKSHDIQSAEVSSSGVAYHSGYVTQIKPRLLQLLAEVIPHPKRSSAKWITSSKPDEKKIAGPEYFVNSVLNRVLFEEAYSPLAGKFLVVEIGVQSCLKHNFSSRFQVKDLSLQNLCDGNSINRFLSELGSLFLSGFNLKIDNLYPKITFPVSRATAPIATYLEWDHSYRNYITAVESLRITYGTVYENEFPVSVEDEAYIKGHCIDGKVLVPAAWYIMKVIQLFMPTVHSEPFVSYTVEIDNIRFLRATTLVAKETVDLTVRLMAGTGAFEVSDKTTPVVQGNIRLVKNALPINRPEWDRSDSPTMTGRDFYKELRLRGYHYINDFRSVQEVRADGGYAKIKWNFNWTVFLDCMFQVMILRSDSRSLMLPTRIEKLRIDWQKHLIASDQCDPKNRILEVFSDPKTNRLVSSGIEVIGMHSTSVERRRPPGLPILERYEFINHLPTQKLSLNEALRMSVQIAIENTTQLRTIKAVEVDSLVDNREPIISVMALAVSDLPLLTPDLKYLTTRKFDIEGTLVENTSLQDIENCTFIIVSGLSSKSRHEFELLAESLHSTGILISRESLDVVTCDLNNVSKIFEIIAVIPTDEETLVLYQKLQPTNLNEHPAVVKISQADTNFKWLMTIQSLIGQKESLILVAENEKTNGLIGFVNCLRKEPNGKTTVRCVFIDDSTAPPFDLRNPFYSKQLKLQQAINVYRNGKWGSFRHFTLEHTIESTERCGSIFAIMGQRGDLSSWKWVDGPPMPEGSLKVCYSSLNFRDIMLSTGRLPIEAAGLGRLEQLCVNGLEFAAIDKNGRRVMGMLKSGSLASHISTDNKLLIPIPDEWSLEEAATVPVVYLTVYYAYFLVGDIRKGKSILIHSGSGGIGLAAIRVALAYGLEVYTTVGSPEKKKFLLETYAQLKEENIGNSRSTSFEDLIRLRTNGRGVDFVLNSLAEDKLHASIRCLGNGGHFLEIGKFDMAQDTKVGLQTFSKGLTFSAICADHLLDHSKHFLPDLIRIIEQDIRAGIITPLPFTIFQASEVEDAFRFMASGKHIGKVIVEIRKNSADNVTYPVKVFPKVYFDKNLVYIVAGGLGGFGLELVDWMIIRGARKFVLSSSRGLTKGYQAYRIKIWQGYGATILINTENISTEKGSENLIREAGKLGTIGGIFNLAVALRDSIFSNQTIQRFIECLEPKSVATLHLDRLSRELCPQLQHFVVFSSVSCGRGNAGQTNYGMANSVMERIVEDRVLNGLPGKAIQWGAIGEVGLVADMAEDKIDLEIGGTLQQRISSCLEELDNLLTTSDPVVASMVVAEKKFGSATGKCSMFGTVLNIMGIRDMKSISVQTNLSGAGLDSLVTVEVRQTLERDFEVTLSLEEIRALTFQRLQEMSDEYEKRNDDTIGGSNTTEDKTQKHKQKEQNLVKKNFGLEKYGHLLIVPPEKTTLTKLSSGVSLVIPGFEGAAAEVWLGMRKSLNSSAYILQLANTSGSSLDELSNEVGNSIFKKVFGNHKTFYIIGYSYGSLVTLKLAKRLENSGLKGHVLLVDGSPVFMKRLQEIPIHSDKDIQNIIVHETLAALAPSEIINAAFAELISISVWKQKVEKLLEIIKDDDVYSKDYIGKMIDSCYRSLVCIHSMENDKIDAIDASITLVRATKSAVPDVEDDYGLSKYTKADVKIVYLEGNHNSLPHNPKLISIINECDPNVV